MCFLKNDIKNIRSTNSLTRKCGLIENIFVSNTWLTWVLRNLEYFILRRIVPLFLDRLNLNIVLKPFKPLNNFRA